jgi:hypothetical protein
VNPRVIRITASWLLVVSLVVVSCGPVGAQVVGELPNPGDGPRVPSCTVAITDIYHHYPGAWFWEEFQGGARGEVLCHPDPNVLVIEVNVSVLPAGSGFENNACVSRANCATTAWSTRTKKDETNCVGAIAEAETDGVTWGPSEGGDCF